MSSHTKTLPRKIGAYEIKQQLGRGAMGEVFMGVHEHLERRAAIKRRVNEAVPMSKDAVERFLREGKSLARLSHHCIVGIFDLFTSRGEWCLVLEYVDGFDLGELIKSGPIPAEITAIIGLRVAEALEYAHFHKIIHRDIKPSNVLISRTGDVKVTDFGIARDDSKEASPLTDTGVVVGTPMYLAPELLAGKDADPRSDIYAVGALLYHALSGRRLYEDAQGESLYPAILGGKYTKLSKITRDVPKALIKIVERCLSKKPEKRYDTSGELRRALEAFLVSHQAHVNHAARLVTFLHARGRITEQESLTCINASELVIEVDGSGTLKPPGKKWPWVLAVVISLLSSAATVAWKMGLYDIRG